MEWQLAMAGLAGLAGFNAAMAVLRRCEVVLAEITDQASCSCSGAVTRRILIHEANLPSPILSVCSHLYCAYVVPERCIQR